MATPANKKSYSRKHKKRQKINNLKYKYHYLNKNIIVYLLRKFNYQKNLLY